MTFEEYVSSRGRPQLTARFGWPHHGFTEADATTVLGGAQVAEDLSRPETWD
ncbi:hypothetical protein [Micromonospora sp. NPDC023814]|uniref:hypothetical protein n=1 Tax=Micromonospora sp. NPDC023814 TaxID=3154596 RepID=UPI0033D30235